MKNSSFSMKTS